MKQSRVTSFKSKYTMLVGLVLFVFIILLSAGIVASIIIVFLYWFNLIPEPHGGRFPLIVVVLFLTSTVIGTVLAAKFGGRPLRPFRKLAEATREIAAGNFDVRVELHGPVEMKSLADDFNVMAKELSSMETLRSDFVRNVSHEFKTPIVSIKGFAKLLKKDTISEENRQAYLDIIIKESDRLAKLAGNVLMLSNLENQTDVGDKTTFSLDEQLRRTVLLLEPEWKKKNIAFDISLEPVLYTGNEALLQQVWLNLLGNAVKFTGNGGEISVSIATAERRLAVKLTDTGIGMDEETVNHLFDKFYQGDKSHSTEGNGLGLSLAKRIVELCGGSIHVESTPGNGSIFFIHLPVDHTETDQHAIAPTI